MTRKCYEDSMRVGSMPTKPAVNVLDLYFDPRHFYGDERPHPAEDLKEVQIGPLSTHVTKIGTTLSSREEARLMDSLKQNVDNFACTIKDMPDIDSRFMCHRLSVVLGAKPVAQKRRRQGEEKQRAIKEETDKLPVVDFIREANGRWRMCTDYTDLNKAHPKDPYPLPSIDRLVDGVLGFALLSFMDAYS
ncbi:hypothetical protein CR513_09686, partial [Mucuna pruriens]